MTRSKRIGFAAVTVLVVLSVLELAARILVPSPDVLVHEEHESLITIGGLPALNQTMEFDPVLFWRLKENLDDFPVAGANGEYEIDFHLTVRRHLRSAPVEKHKQHTRILVLGDSCAFGVGVEDDQTWPHQLESALRANDYGVRVINAGVPGYTAYQGLKYLESNVDSLQPDLVIACFGFNDQETWASRSDLQTAKSLEARRWQLELLYGCRLLYGLDRFLQSDPAAEKHSRLPRPRLLPEEFIRTLSGIRTVCDQWHARLVLVIWPYRIQVETKNQLLDLYQTVVSRFGSRFDVPVVNLVPGFITADEVLYVDHIHANAAGCRIAATTIAQSVSPILDALPQPNPHSTCESDPTKFTPGDIYPGDDDQASMNDVTLKLATLPLTR